MCGARICPYSCIFHFCAVKVETEEGDVGPDAEGWCESSTACYASVVGVYGNIGFAAGLGQI
jgi:hypothetical protein